MATFAPANATCHFIPPDVIVKTFGALLIGFLIQQFLLGVVVTQACIYFSRFHRRDIKFYRYEYSHNLPNQHNLLQPTSLFCLPGLDDVGGAWRHGHGLFFRYLASVILLLPAGSGLAMSILSFKVKVLSEINKLPIPTSIWLGSFAATDTVIGGILCSSFLRSRSLCCHMPTKSALTKLVCLSIETSFCTAACAAINLILYLTLPGTLYRLLLQFSMCRVYTIMVLFTLLQRDGLRKTLDGQVIYDISLVLFEPQYNNSIKHGASVESGCMATQTAGIAC
ncbi:hypothetical protein B0H10DRAFT_1970266 [Mycena sp. CBHHK59/15]|nr:hypothetical protein B0H10DRAFT_1970266 [Mycena sp. CBHHK59/15]